MNGQVGIAMVLGGVTASFLTQCETHRAASTAAPAASATVALAAPAMSAGAKSARDSGNDASPNDDAPRARRVTSEGRVLRFAWQPPEGPTAAYEMPEEADQHRIVLPRDLARDAAYPVLVAFHGHPRRGEAPRNYAFAERVLATTARMMDTGEVSPFVVVLPVFRYLGTNWPQFDVALFKKEVEARLADEGLKTSGYYVVGHSGAAGCGGDGMNRAHRMSPAAVGFFDTCLGRGWRDEVERLRAARVPTLLMHSLETAAFSPKQTTEYLSSFDFGRAYGPAGLAPKDCPAELPKAPLRAQPFRCSADEQGVARGLIVDSGEGEEGHNALVPIALEYFLRVYVGARATQR